LENLKIKLFADGADLAEMTKLYRNPRIVASRQIHPHAQGWNSDYVAFAQEVLRVIPDRPVSFEVFADELDEIERQARVIATWEATSTSKSPLRIQEASLPVPSSAPCRETELC